MDGFVTFGYFLGLPLGLYAAGAAGSIANAVVSICIPWYGVVYWMFSL